MNETLVFKEIKIVIVIFFVGGWGSSEWKTWLLSPYLWFIMQGGSREDNINPRLTLVTGCIMF